MERVRIGLLGGVPPLLGGGGLERQIAETGEALERLGHEVIHITRAEKAASFDVLHAFGSEPDVCHAISHWRLNPAPLVVSPVLVVPPQQDWLVTVEARVPLESWGPRMRARLLRRADLVVAQTHHEAKLARRLGATRCVVVPNGVRDEKARPPRWEETKQPYVLLLGSVSPRKRQLETVSALKGHHPVVAGGFYGSDSERAAFDAAVSEAGGAWLGEVHDRSELLGLVQQARALVLVSRAEGQPLAVLEAISRGTPAIVSRLPSTEELASQFPEHVLLVDDMRELSYLVDHMPPRPTSPAHVPTWDAVALHLARHYRPLLDNA